jgi:hypothetical protein
MFPAPVSEQGLEDIMLNIKNRFVDAFLTECVDCDKKCLHHSLLYGQWTSYSKKDFHIPYLMKYEEQGRQP